MLKFTAVVTRALGEEAAAELARSLEAAIETSVRAQAVPRDEYRTVLSRLDIIEHDLAGINASVNARLDRVEARLDALRGEMDSRFDAVHARFDALASIMDARFDALASIMDARFDALQRNFDARFDALHDTLHSQTRWLIGTLIAIGGLISALITVFEFIR